MKLLSKTNTAAMLLLACFTLLNKQSKAQGCMMKHNHSDDSEQNINTTSSDTAKTEQVFYYTCSMHPEIKSDVPGTCPKCGMTLVKTSGNEKPKSKMMGMMGKPMNIVMIAMMVVMIAVGMTFLMGNG